MTGRVSSAPANSFTASIESKRSSVTNSTSLPSSRINNSAPWYPEMFRAAMLGKISSRNMSSYAFASAGLVQPCQIRAIILHPHNLVTAVDINDLACDGGRAVAREKHSGLAEFRRLATAFQRRALLIML